MMSVISPAMDDRCLVFVLAQPAHVEMLVEVEKTAYSHPWSRRHFVDSISQGHRVVMLVMSPDAQRDPSAWAHAPLLPDGRWLLCYAVVMRGVDEVHLLNLTTVPVHRRQGWARLMMEALRQWALSEAAETLWLEVRASNGAARQLYTGLGLDTVGLRKGYYPSHDRAREDAVVMRWSLRPVH